MKQIGDIVQLKSGGNLMTVTGYDRKNGQVMCDWIADDGSPQDSTYPELALDNVLMHRIHEVIGGSET